VAQLGAHAQAHPRACMPHTGAEERACMMLADGARAARRSTGSCGAAGAESVEQSGGVTRRLGNTCAVRRECHAAAAVRTLCRHAAGAAARARTAGPGCRAGARRGRRAEQGRAQRQAARHGNLARHCGQQKAVSTVRRMRARPAESWTKAQYHQSPLPSGTCALTQGDLHTQALETRQAMTGSYTKSLCGRPRDGRS